MERDKLIRLFIAVDLEGALKDRVTALIESLRKAQADVKWVQQDNLHITLKFLGDVAEERLPIVVETARNALSGFSAFEMGIGGVGTFPPRGKPRVVWLAVEDKLGQLVGMCKALEESFAKIGFPAEDRPFTGHLTIGRVRSPKGVERLQSAVAGLRVPEGLRMMVDKVLLIKSVLTSAGPLYSILETMFLEG